jgi:hypothetical protein
MRDNRAADQLGDLRHYRVSEAPQSVQPMGKPISHSTNFGLSRPPRCWAICSSEGLNSRPVVWLIERPSEFNFRPPALTTGVGHNPDPIPPMRRTNGTSRDTMPLRIVPDFGQVAENDVLAARPECGHVFHDCVSRSNFANEPMKLSPEPRPLAFEARAFAGITDILAGKSPADNGWFESMLFEPPRRKSFHVFKNWYCWPVSPEHSAGVGLALAKCNGVHASSFKPEAEPADARKQVENPKFLTCFDHD